MKYAHTNIVSRDWKKLAAFYEKVFNCRPVPPVRDLKGEWVQELTGIENVHIEGIHLSLPGYKEGGPTIEIFTYNKLSDGELHELNQPGFAHIAFSVDNVEEVLKRVVKEGGSQEGKLVVKELPNLGVLTVVYCRDPEGNIIELQRWKNEG